MGLDRTSPHEHDKWVGYECARGLRVSCIEPGYQSPPLSTILLDDPLQSLDDINLLGLIDLLRQTKDQRQLLVSTHDERFGNLLGRKLRPRTAAQRTIVVELEGWTRQGAGENRGRLSGINLEDWVAHNCCEVSTTLGHRR